MRSFCAIVWSVSDPKAARAAATLEANVEESATNLRRTAAGRGFVLYDMSRTSVDDSTIAITDRSNEVVGALFGVLFERGDASSHSLRIRNIAHQITALIAKTQGEHLIKNYWGRYIAILGSDESPTIIVDPTGALPCYFYECDGALLLFSNLELCNFIPKSALTVDIPYVSLLFAYDKLQDGRTGLKEIRELLGGQRLRLSHEGWVTDQIWDPRNYAADRLEVRASEASKLLRDRIDHVVGSWMSLYTDIVICLSGGLDSSIVLNSAMSNSEPRTVRSVHFELASEDASELHYAKAAADSDGCELVVVRADPMKACRELKAYPLTPRPYRQLLALDRQAALPAYLKNSEGAVFTGQGGDHLFLASKSDSYVVDFILNRGISPAAFAQLIFASKLSKLSIWRVLQRSFGHITGGHKVNAMQAGIACRRTSLNATSHSLAALESALPEWASSSNGLPPGKYDQVSTLVHLFQIRDQLSPTGARENIHPLISQPLIELCLRLPTYILCSQGVSRGLAKSAFHRRIHNSIVSRTSKGGANRFYNDRVAAIASDVSADLRDGELVRNNMLSQTALDDYFSSQRFLFEQSGNMLLVYRGIEMWLRSWREAGAKFS